MGEVKANITTFTDTVTGAWKQQFSYYVTAYNFVNADGSGALQESTKSNVSIIAIPVPPNAPSGLTISR